MRDDLDGLSEYFEAFSSLGSVPTSLGGYGYSGRHEAELSALGVSAAGGPGWDIEAIGKKPPVSVFSKFGCKDNRCTERYQEWTPYPVIEIARDLVAVQAFKRPASKSWAATAPGWKAYATAFRVYPEAQPASGGTFSSEFVWINKLARAQLAKNAAAAGGAPPPQQKSTPAPSGGKSAGNPIVLGTAAVQDILIRLGWRGKDTTKGAIQTSLTDGLYGSAVATNWQQSAKKRKLDPSISKKAADGTTVTVNEATYYALKTLADQLVPPTQKQPDVVQPPAAATTTTTEKRLNEVLGRLSGAPAGATLPWDQLVALYQKAAKSQNLDPSISKNAIRCVTTPCPPDQVVVNADTWKVLMAAYDKAAPAPAPPAPAEKSDVERAMEEIKKRATSSLSAKTLKHFFNIAIKQKVIKREPFTNDKWSADYAPLLIAQSKTEGPWAKAWEQLLVPGKLVAKDLASVKLYPELVSSIQKVVSDYDAAQKAGEELFKGYTKVNSAQTIEWVNALSISDKTFDKSGGYKTLADALKTFLDNTKQTVVGDLVKVQEKTKDVFVQDELLKKLAAAKKAIEDRQKATESYRKNMVAEALKASSDTVNVDQIQQAIAAVLMSKAALAPEDKKLYEAVKRNGAFDSETRSAYTALAKRLTLETPIRQFEKLLRDQLGPRFKSKMVEEVYGKTWSEFLDKAVDKKDGKIVVKTLPVLAKKIRDDAVAYRKVKGDDKIAREKEAEFDKTMAEAVKKSHVIISLYDVQMGLLEPAKPKAVGVTTSGRGDEPTKVALFNLVADKIFGTKHKERWDWDKYLDAVGIRVESNTSVKKGWAGANWVALPQAAADLLAKHAEKWLARNAPPAGYNDLAPLPLQNEELRLRFDKPSVIKVKRPTTEKPTDGTPAPPFERWKKACAACSGIIKTGPASDLDPKAGSSFQVQYCELSDGRRFGPSETEVQLLEKACPATQEDVKKKRSKADRKRQAAAEAKKKAKRDRERAEKARKEAEEAKRLAEQNAADQKAQEEAARKEQEAKVAEAIAAKAAADAAAAQVESAVAEKDAQSAATSAGGAGGAGAGGAGGATGPVTAGGAAVNINFTDREAGPVISPTPAPEPAPTPTPPAPEPTPAPVEPMQAGMGSGFLWLTLAGLGYMLFGPKDEKQTKRGGTRYSTPGGRP